MPRWSRNRAAAHAARQAHAVRDAAHAPQALREEGLEVERAPAPLALPLDDAQRALEDRYVREPDALRPGHRVEVLIDGAATYPAMLAAIAGARHYVHLEVYIFESDAIGRRFVDALIERARAGLEVRVLVDGIGSFGFADVMGPDLRAGGVELEVYAPLGRRWMRRWMHRDHRKILVVDGERGFVGGINIGLEYAPREDGGHGWRDTHCEVQGPAVVQLEEMFRATWQRAGGAPLRRRARVADESVAAPGTERAIAIGTDHVGTRGAIRRAILHAIKAAEHRIWATSAYFVPDRSLRRALAKAVRRGVDVQIIVPAHSDLKSVQWAGEYTYAGLLRRGVRIHQWHEAHVHAKTMAIDGVWSMIGSYNLDYVSLLLNQEVVLLAVGSPTAGRLEQVFEADVARSREVHLAAWLERRWWRRALAWVFYRFRRFL